MDNLEIGSRVAETQRQIKLEDDNFPDRLFSIGTNIAELHFVHAGREGSKPVVYVSTGRQTENGVEIWAPRP